MNFLAFIVKFDSKFTDCIVTRVKWLGNSNLKKLITIIVIVKPATKK